MAASFSAPVARTCRRAVVYRSRDGAPWLTSSSLSVQFVAIPLTGNQQLKVDVRCGCVKDESWSSVVRRVFVIVVFDESDVFFIRPVIGKLVYFPHFVSPLLVAGVRL